MFRTSRTKKNDPVGTPILYASTHPVPSGLDALRPSALPVGKALSASWQAIATPTIATPMHVNASAIGTHQSASETTAYPATAAKAAAGVLQPTPAARP